jgi:leishmanolysin
VWVDISLISGIRRYKGGKAAYDIIVKSLIPSCIEHISQTYEVYKKSKIRLYSSRCGDIDDIGPYYQKVIDGDLVVFIYYVNKNMGAVAYASSCQYDRVTGRPIAGQVVLNLYHMNDFRSSNFENNFMTVLHEIHHVLGFSPFFFSKFVMPGTTERRPKYDIIQDFRGSPFKKQIVMKPVVEWARKHFNCPSMQGVPVENTGGSGTLGSHWDKAIAANDLMGPTDYSNPIFGELTMKFMEGTGWYKVNYDMAEFYWWAKGSGCGIFSGECRHNPMTCGLIGRKMCSYDYYAQGKCREDSYAEACPIFAEVSKGDCRFTQNKDPRSVISQTTYYGIGSRCIMGKIGSGSKIQYAEYPNCLKARCKDAQTVLIEVEGQTVVCTQSFKVMNYKAGSSRYVRCPNIAHFCFQENVKCPNDCSNHGRCLKSKKCWCFIGFEGADCSQPEKGTFRYNTLGTIKGGIKEIGLWVLGVVVIGFGFVGAN